MCSQTTFIGSPTFPRQALEVLRYNGRVEVVSGALLNKQARRQNAAGGVSAFH